ncbi:hypothetical protein ADP71_31590 [Vitreoscilla sp. C1]|uniref:hypothetical protein n=1 Tax=Vitreoscilla sp. (strain C1) TaxID=96942 RepID=UPI000CDC4B1A|nr:hypothetical protein [Vitreoscilla sp. C1]AUZ06337.1 hypothetical protein ADP71_31590 [Vitreoscilla sp. C1]
MVANVASAALNMLDIITAASQSGGVVVVLNMDHEKQVHALAKIHGIKFSGRQVLTYKSLLKYGLTGRNATAVYFDSWNDRIGTDEEIHAACGGVPVAMKVAVEND